MDRKVKLLSGLNLSTAIGAEIGALCRPVVARSDGTVYYIVSTYPFFTQMTGFAGGRWFGIEPISSGVFGVPAGFLVAIGVSLIDRKPDAYTIALVDYIRHP